MDRDETDVGLVTIYGVTKKDLDELLTKHNITVDHAEMPGLCSPDEMLTQGELRRQEQTPQSQQSSSTHSSSGGSYYYYNDPVDDFCCYYACYPRRRYRAYSPTANTACCATNSSNTNTNCDCNDSGSDNDFAAIFLVIILLIAIIAIIVFFGPSLVAASLVGLELLISGVLLLFNILTLGIYRDDLSRNRIRIRKAAHDDLNNFLIEIVEKKGLPKMPGYWTQGFILLRYGAVFFVVGLITLIGMFFIDISSAKIYLIPAGVIVISLVVFFTGNYLINKKIHEVKQHLTM